MHLNYRSARGKIRHIQGTYNITIRQGTASGLQGLADTAVETLQWHIR